MDTIFSKLNLATGSSIAWNKIKSLKGLQRNNQINLIYRETNKIILLHDVVNPYFGKYFQQNSKNSSYNK